MNVFRIVLFVAPVVLGACGKTQAQGDAPPTIRAAPGVVAAAQAAESADLGVPLYPGMTTLVAAHRVAGAGGGMVAADFKSADGPDKVVAFYRERLGRQFGDKTVFQESPLGEGMVRLQATDGTAQSTTVMVRADGTGSIVGIQTLARRN